MTIEACAAQVAKGDPDRFTALRAAPVPVQQVMWPILALNLEVARAPWVASEPMIAEMRMQWWRDVLEEIATGKPPRAHEVAAPLHAVLAGQDAAIAHLDRLIAARRWDVWRDPFPNTAAMTAYLEDTSAGVLLAAARVLGWDPAQEGPLRDAGYAFGLAGWLMAAPALKNSGRRPLPGEDDEVLRHLAGEGLARLSRARKCADRKAAPLLRMGWMAEPILRHAARDPGAVLEGRLARSEFYKRGRLALKAFSGRW